MTTATRVRGWFGITPGLTARQYVRSKEHALFVAAAAVIFVHLLTQAFIDPEAMSSASDNIITGIAGPAIVALLAAVYPQLATGFRAAAAIVLGLFAIIAGLVIHVPHAVAVERTISDVTAFAAAASGLMLFGLGLWSAWKALPRLYYKLLLIPAVPIVMLQIVLPVALATYIVNTPRTPLGAASPADYGLAYESVRFDAADGVTIAAWYVPSKNGAAVILVHGAGKNRTKTLEHGAMLARNGYGALMIDMRGYGESEGSPVAWGWTGEQDVGAAVTYLESRDDVEPGRIGALGLSMGGEIVLHAAGVNDGIAAVVAEGSGMHTWKEFDQEPGSVLKYVGIFNIWNAYTAVELMSGVDQPPSNKDMLEEIAPRPVLLISTGQGEEGNWGRFLHKDAGPTARLWETDGGHIDGLAEQPAEYETRVTTLFDEALLGN
jgi:pimeloyl-ACP methyl ester carboxylesterase